MKDEDQLKELYKVLCQASIDKDINTLKKILREDYILVHMTGKRQTKEEYINSVEQGELKYYESIHEEIIVEVKEDKAKIIGKTKTLASPFRTIKSWWNLKQELEAIKENGEWKLTHSIASMY